MRLGRPQQFDEGKVLSSAMNTFWALGYESASLQDLLEATGLSKSSLYQAFGDKEALFLTCLEKYRLDMKEQLLTQLSLSKSGLGFIEQVLLSSAEEAGLPHPRGCLVMNTAAEIGLGNSKISKEVEKGVQTFKEVFQTALQKAEKEGMLSRGADLEGMALFIVSSLSGLKSMVKAGASKDSVEQIVKVTMNSIS